MRSLAPCSFLTVALLPAAHGFQLPFKLPFFPHDTDLYTAPEKAPASGPPRIAIIGAGPAGSSAAFWLSKAKDRLGVEYEIDVYERESYIGGRSTVVYPHENTSLPALELGASVFVKVNKNMWRASNEFNLSRVNFEKEGGTTGIWDGEDLVFSFSDGWWDTVKAIWRYGVLSPRRTDAIVKGMVQQLDGVYAADPVRWDTIPGLAANLGWKPLIQTTTEAYYTSAGVSDRFIHEVIEAATRVNYGQDVDGIHALEGSVSMAASSAAGVQGGNFQIFENFIKRSKANIQLKTPVTKIAEVGSDKWSVSTSLGSTKYQAVILAAPYHFTGISMPSTISSQIPHAPYVHLHVTLLTTTSPNFDPAYFAQQDGTEMPTMMLTTNDKARKGGKAPEFNSISYHGEVREGEWAVKVFSKERISDEWLSKLFFDKVTWVHRKEWNAYPENPPMTEFAPIKLGQGFYYVNAFEPFISTMETETVAARNVVDLLLQEQFNGTICGPVNQDRTLEVGEDFVYGWDC